MLPVRRSDPAGDCGGEEQFFLCEVPKEAAEQEEEILTRSGIAACDFMLRAHKTKVNSGNRLQVGCPISRLIGELRSRTAWILKMLGKCERSKVGIDRPNGKVSVLYPTLSNVLRVGLNTKIRPPVWPSVNTDLQHVVPFRQ